MSVQKAPKKKRKLSEYHSPWLVASLLGMLLSSCGVGALVSGVVGSRLAFRGHSGINVLLALLALLLFAISGFYLLRKRLFQEEFSLLRASMQSWLWAHMYLALFGTWLIFLHAGYSLLTLEVTSGKLALFALLASIGTGIVWRVVYFVVPKRAAKSVGNYSAAGSLAEAGEIAIEIEKRAAGLSAAFHQAKQRLLDSFTPRQELERLLASLPPEERQALQEVAQLADQRRRALGRTHAQRGYVRLLQAWRILHVPVTGLFLLLIPVHVVLAYRLPAKLVIPGTIDGVALGGFETADQCANCHARIVREWRGSLHARAMSRETMIAQTNQDLKTTLKGAKGPDPKDLCINCHGPIGAALTSQSELPLRATTLTSDEKLLNEGVSCGACHQYNGRSFPGKAALSQFMNGYQPGRTYYGPHADAVPNSFHQSEVASTFLNPGELCQNCHSVNYDLNADGRIEKGKDLVLQTIVEEWQHYRQQGGSASCVDCHMPVGDATRSAEEAWIPFEQDYEASPRAVREHTFIGADHRLDITEAEDAHAPARKRLLQSAASLSLDDQSITLTDNVLSLRASIANVGTGHRLPGGFAFVRQLWLEVKVTTQSGELLASSGIVESPQHDLCDAEMFTGISRSVLEFTLGCKEPDPLLVNFQSILLDRIETARAPDGSIPLDELGQAKLAPAENAQETFLQHFTSGPVARTRGFDKKPIPALDPGEQRSFEYRFDLGARSNEAKLVEVRLMFRAIAPYFLRALGKNQAPAETPVAPSVANLRIDELGRVSAPIPPAK